MITLIAAVGEQWELGKNNQLLWHLPDDFKRFKSITTGHYIVMGRKTFESFPRPLPHRTHVIITRQKDYQVENCIVVNSLAQALSVCPKESTTFIIGGGEIYHQAIAIADRLEITRVHHRFEADAFFPIIDLTEWNLLNEEYHPKDERHAYDFSYQTYQRK